MEVTALQLDHLVIGCRDLDQGSRWVRERLGVGLEPGGRHALMGTHNRLLNLGQRVYLEVIAIDPDATGPQDGRRPWFDLGDAGLQAQLLRSAALIHAVYRVADLEAALAAWGDPGFECVQASRGALSWRIAVRADGRRVPGRPTLIEWGEVHPTDSLPESSVRLRHFDGRRASLQSPLGLVELPMLA